MQTFSNSIKLASNSISPDLQRIIQLVKSRRFNELRCWISNRISLPLAGSQFDFGGFIRLLEDCNLCTNHYSVSFQCWSYCYISEKRLNLSSIYTFKDNCQKTINNHISSSFHCLKCRDPEANIEQTSPSVSVALRRIGATHPKLTADLQHYSSLFIPCRMLYTLLSTIFHSVNFAPIIPVES